MTRKRTFSLPDDISEQLDLVAGSNVSAYVTEAVRARIAREAAAQRIRSAYGDIDAGAYAEWIRRLGPDTADPRVGGSGPRGGTRLASSSRK